MCLRCFISVVSYFQHTSIYILKYVCVSLSLYVCVYVDVNAEEIFLSFTYTNYLSKQRFAVQLNETKNLRNQILSKIYI